MNINEMLEWPKVLVVVVLLVSVASAMFFKERSPLSLGGMAVPIAMFTGIGFFRQELPEWTIYATFIVALTLFVIGLFSPENKDRYWHFGAMITALFGKTILWLLTLLGPALWAFMRGGVEIKFYGWMLAAIIGVAFGLILARNKRVRRWLDGRRTHHAPTTT